jgi:hypothetical protein
VSDCPDGDFLLFDFIDDSVITNPNLPKPSERLTQPDPIPCRLCRKPTVNGPNDPGANVRWKLRQVLCRECDNAFSPWDKHAQEVLLHDFSDAAAIYAGPRKIGWTITRFDYRLLKLFFLSLLWRASVSTHEFYRRVSIGPFETELRAMIANADPGAAETFAVTLSRFDHPALRAMLDPHPERHDGVNYCRFYLAGFVAHIKVDRRYSASLAPHRGRPRSSRPSNACSRPPLTAMQFRRQRLTYEVNCNIWVQDLKATSSNICTLRIAEG